MEEDEIAKELRPQGITAVKEFQYVMTCIV